MSQPPVPPRKRNAPIVVYPGSPPPPAGARPTARPAPPQGPPPTAGRGGGGGQPRQPEPSRSREEPTRRSGGKRAAIIALVVVAVIAIAGGAFAVLSGGGGDSGPEFKASTSVDLQPGETKVEAVGFASPELPAEARDQMLSAIGTYVDGGIVKALRTGKADDAELTPIFDAAAATQLTGPGRASLFDEGLPKAVGKIAITTPPVAFTALADRDGTIVLVSANLDLKVRARAEKGTVTVQRTGSFVFAPDPSGVWKISGWTFNTARGGNALPTTSVPAAPTASSTPEGQ